MMSGDDSSTTTLGQQQGPPSRKIATKKGQATSAAVEVAATADKTNDIENDEISVDLLNDDDDFDDFDSHHCNRTTLHKNNNNTNHLQNQQETPSPRGSNRNNPMKKDFSSPMISPATQTFNALSQDEGGFTYETTHTAVETATETTTNTKKPSSLGNTGNDNGDFNTVNDNGASSERKYQRKSHNDEKNMLKSATTANITNKQKMMKGNVSLSASATKSSKKGRPNFHKNKNKNKENDDDDDDKDNGKRQDENKLIVDQSSGSISNWSNLKHDWELHAINITEPNGKLGLSIFRDHFTGIVRSRKNSRKGGGEHEREQDHDDDDIISTPQTTEEPQFVRVAKVVDACLASMHGVQKGDWICHPEKEDVEEIRLAKFEVIQKVSKTRPFRFMVLRPRGSTIETKKVATAVASTASTSSHDDGSGSGGLAMLADASSMAVPAFHTPEASSFFEPQDLTNKKRKRVQRHFLLNEMVSQQSNKKKSRTSSSIAGGGWTGRITQKQKSSSKSLTSSSTLPSSNGNKKNKQRQTLPSAPNKQDGNFKVQFCGLCNYGGRGPKPKMHHAWCFNNPFYENSGAVRIMERIQYGKNKLRCGSCEKEFCNGRLYKRGHTRDCLQYQEKFKRKEYQANKEDQVQNFDQHDDDPDDEKTKKKKQDKDKKRSKITVESPPTSSSNDEEEEEEDSSDDGSVYCPTKKRRRIQVLGVGPVPSKKKGQTIPPHSNKAKRKKSSNKDNNDENKEVEESVRVTPTPAEELEVDVSSNAVDVSVRSNWIDYQSNPWGPSGHVEGDVVLFGGPPGLSSYETLIPSERYKSNPFEKSSGYRSTHVTPEEGLAFLQLRRDPMATRPWGFRVGKDEFGEACLVEAVDPLSPAASAVS